MLGPVKTKVRALLCSVTLLAGCFISSAVSAQVPTDSPFLLGPPDTGEPTTVHVGFFLSDVTDVDEEREMFEFESVLTINWHDQRQAFDAEKVGVEELIYQGQYQFNEVFDGWWPQLVLANESGQFEKQGEVLKIKPDGSMTYIVEMDAVVKSQMNLHHFPFDSQRLEIIFKCLGFDPSEVLLMPDQENSGYRAQGVGLAQWEFQGMEVSPLNHSLKFADGHLSERSHIAIHVNMERNPNFILRLVVIPLILLVMLSWSIFWMDKESLGDRMDISFVGILTVVAYQIMIGETLPRIDYLTLMSTFLYLSFISLAAGVVVNLYVAHLDNRGKVAEGNKVDRLCRWLFPAAYISLNVLGAGFFILLN